MSTKMKSPSKRPHRVRHEIAEGGYPVISLFSGAMGLDLGLEAAGLSVQVAQDVDHWCIKTAVDNNKVCIAGDLKVLIKKDPKCEFLRRKTRLSKKHPLFAVVGGPPCQSFSTAGKRKSVNDPRGSLFMEFCHVIREMQPRFFVMENVKGLLSSAISHRPIAERDNGKPLSPEETPGSAFEVIIQEFQRLRYKVIYGILDAVYYGVPQFRERLVMVGSRDHEDIFLPIPTHFRCHQDPVHRWQTLHSAIADLEDDAGLCAGFSEERLKYLKTIPPGGNWHDLDKNVLQAAMGGAYNSGGGKVGFYRRLDYEQPSPTLVTSPVQKATMLCHPKKDRPLSVQEYARIQQFPDDWGDVRGVHRLTPSFLRLDELALTVEDESSEEQRFVTMGMDILGRIILVVYTWRGNNIRLISARKATAGEREEYKERR